MVEGEVISITREFVAMPEFEKQWKIMALNDHDLQRLQNELLNDPQTGSVLKGTGRLRKMRFAFEGHGKSGSARVVYVDFSAQEIIFLIFAYPKSVKESLTKEERNDMKKLIEHLETIL